VYRIVRRARQKHSDLSHPLGLLRARRKRPCSCAAEQRDEVAPFQLIELHSVPCQHRIALYRFGRD
jgi:hypothetical protein